MENQAVIATMVYRLAGTASDNEKGNRVNDAYTDFTLYSERTKSPLYSQIKYINGAFLFCFFIGSALTLYARYLELEAVDSQGG